MWSCAGSVTVLPVVFYNIAIRHILFSHLTLWVSGLVSQQITPLKKYEFILVFDIVIKNYAMQFKPSLFIYLPSYIVLICVFMYSRQMKLYYV